MMLRDAARSFRSLRDWDAAPIFSVMCIGGALASDAFRQLNGWEIKAKFASQELTGQDYFAQVFNRDGTLSVNAMGTRKTGRWHVDGDELCLASGADESRCHQVWMSGKKVQLRQPGIIITEDGVLQRPAARN